MPRAGQITRTHCKNCNVELNNFNCIWHGAQSRGPRCRKCHNADMKTNYYKRKANGVARDEVLKKYGITSKEYNEMFEFQQGGCAICRQPPKEGVSLSVDHNHTNGKIRGLLCKDCNFAISGLKEDEDLIFRAMEYLKRTTWSETCPPQV